MSNSISHSNTLSQAPTVSAAARAASHQTVRRKFLSAFLCLSIGAASLGGYAMSRLATPQTADSAAISAPASASGLTVIGAAGNGWIDALAQVADSKMQRLIDVATGDAFPSQGRAQDKMTDAKFKALLMIGAAMIMGGIIVTLLAQQIMGSIFSLSAVICRMTAEPADHYGADGTAALLTTMGTMRDNITAMAAIEIAERQQGRPIPAKPTAKSNAGMTKRKQVELISEPL